MISKEVKDYCWGLYGRSPAPIDEDIRKMILKGYEKGETPITGRAADMLQPELEEAKAESREFARTIQDVLLYAQYRTTGARFLKYKYGIDKTIPEDWKPPRAPRTMEEIKQEDELIARAKAGKLVEKVEKPIPAKGPGVRTFNVFVEDEYYQVEVEAVGELGSRQSAVGSRQSAVSSQQSAVSSPPPLPDYRLATRDYRVAAEPRKKAAAPTAAEGEKVLAPVPGMIIRYEVKVGDQVKADDTVVILESMKMENTILAPVDGTVTAINFGRGDNVSRNDVLAVVTPG
jgi:pyruvate carboxylase subunit B